MGFFDFFRNRNMDLSEISRDEIVKDFPLIIRNGDEIVGAFNGGTENMCLSQKNFGDFIQLHFPTRTSDVELLRGVVFSDTELYRSITQHGYSFQSLFVIVNGEIIKMIDGVVPEVDILHGKVPQKFRGHDVIFVGRIVIVFKRSL